MHGFEIVRLYGEEFARELGTEEDSFALNASFEKLMVKVGKDIEMSDLSDSVDLFSVTLNKVLTDETNLDEVVGIFQRAPTISRKENDFTQTDGLNFRELKELDETAQTLKGNFEINAAKLNELNDEIAAKKGTTRGSR